MSLLASTAVHERPFSVWAILFRRAASSSVLSILIMARRWSQRLGKRPSSGNREPEMDRRGDEEKDKWWRRLGVIGSFLDAAVRIAEICMRR